MNKLLTAGALAAVLTIVPSAARAQSVVHLAATMTAGDETPALLSGSVGTVQVAVDTVNRELTVDLSVFNLATGATAGHIHVGPKGVAGPVVIDFPVPRGTTGDFTISFRAGTAVFHARPEIGINTIDDAIQAMVGGGAYANIHTSANPAGEIRGQLVVVP